MTAFLNQYQIDDFILIIAEKDANSHIRGACFHEFNASNAYNLHVSNLFKMGGSRKQLQMGMHRKLRIKARFRPMR